MAFLPHCVRLCGSSHGLGIELPYWWLDEDINDGDDDNCDDNDHNDDNAENNDGSEDYSDDDEVYDDDNHDICNNNVSYCVDLQTVSVLISGL